MSDQPPVEVPLLACEAVPGGYQVTLRASDTLQVAFSLEQLDGTFVDVGTPIEAP